jgi:hypothetical protein
MFVYVKIADTIVTNCQSIQSLFSPESSEHVNDQFRPKLQYWHQLTSRYWPIFKLSVSANIYS